MQDGDLPEMEDREESRRHVSVSPSQIPDVQEPMPVLRLGDRVLALTSQLERMAGNVSPGTTWGRSRKGDLRLAYAGERLVAAVNPSTGESRIFPQLETLKPAGDLDAHGRSVAAHLAADRAFFPADDTHIVRRPTTVLFGCRHTRAGEQTRPAAYLGYVKLRRHVGVAPVFGPGTGANLAVAGDGTVHALTHLWRVASAGPEKVKAHAREVIAERIKNQLAASGSARNARIHVDGVTLAYYDGGAELMQPVYRYRATVASLKLGLKSANRHIVGFVSIGEAPEPLPVVGVRRGMPPIEPPARRTSQQAGADAVQGDPTVGRYVVRNDSDEWVSSANEFLDGLNEAQNLFGSPIAFTDSQYFWAYPRLFLADKDSFINSVQIALNEVHGNWNWFSTRDNNDDGVSLSTIPAPGYGGGGNGSLAYWIIHSCEVIPTQTDEPSSFDVWWNIFNGLHAAVSYRTDMWIDDDVMGPFGLWMGLGVPVVPGWLNEVASNDSYDDGDTYHDGNRNIDEPMGRASAVTLCGHADDTARDVDSLGSATCLTEWWFDN